MQKPPVGCDFWGSHVCEIGRSNIYIRPLTSLVARSNYTWRFRSFWLLRNQLHPFRPQIHMTGDAVYVPPSVTLYCSLMMAMSVLSWAVLQWLRLVWIILFPQTHFNARIFGCNSVPPMCPAEWFSCTIPGHVAFLFASAVVSTAVNFILALERQVSKLQAPVVPNRNTSHTYLIYYPSDPNSALFQKSNKSIRTSTKGTISQT